MKWNGVLFDKSHPSIYVRCLQLPKISDDPAICYFSNFRWFSTIWRKNLRSYNFGQKLREINIFLKTFNFTYNLICNVWRSLLMMFISWFVLPKIHFLFGGGSKTFFFSWKTFNKLSKRLPAVSKDHLFRKVGTGVENHKTYVIVQSVTITK